MGTRPKVLIIDDEPAIRRFLRTSLVGQGYDVIEAVNGADAIRRMTDERPDLAILDLGLPDMDGLAVIQKIRLLTDIPILVLSVRDDEGAKVQALDLGASDYVTKPFGMAELMARLRTAMRHRLMEQGHVPAVRIRQLALDLVRRIVTLHDQPLHLTPKEYDLLSYLVRHAGKVITHRQLLREIWGEGHVEQIEYLRSYVRMLRQKIETDSTRPEILLTEPGVGYRMALPDEPNGPSGP